MLILLSSNIKVLLLSNNSYAADVGWGSHSVIQVQVDFKMLDQNPTGGIAQGTVVLSSWR